MGFFESLVEATEGGAEFCLNLLLALLLVGAEEFGLDSCQVTLTLNDWILACPFTRMLDILCWSKK